MHSNRGSPINSLDDLRQALTPSRSKGSVSPTVLGGSCTRRLPRVLAVLTQRPIISLSRAELPQRARHLLETAGALCEARKTPQMVVWVVFTIYPSFPHLSVKQDGEILTPRGKGDSARDKGSPQFAQFTEGCQRRTAAAARGHRGVADLQPGRVQCLTWSICHAGRKARWVRPKAASAASRSSSVEELTAQVPAPAQAPALASAQPTLPGFSVSP